MAREVDIRDIMRFLLIPGMFGMGDIYDEDEDSDYDDDDDEYGNYEYDIIPPRQRARPVATNEVFENGHRVIEILDDDDSTYPIAAPTPAPRASPPRAARRAVAVHPPPHAPHPARRYSEDSLFFVWF